MSEMIDWKIRAQLPLNGQMVDMGAFELAGQQVIFILQPGIFSETEIETFLAAANKKLRETIGPVPQRRYRRAATHSK